MFSNLIAKSMNKETSLYSHPSFVNIIKQLSTYDARILAYIYECQIESNINIIIDDNDLLFPLSSLEKQGLIHVHMQQSAQTLSIDKNLLKLHTNFDVNIPIKTAYITLTKLGDTFCDICLNSEI
ncbi:Abi-alpha family protein [Roseburia sp. 1XD42-69]|uniref:Abi-alpha family protein n=1 Tax=Roseburia sp. 1XD42-69 TaxID=2320088 RepID=UPI000EA3AD3A|nr:Abi-alpha family protein [Roseburia sp. 1XD42-69]RKJ68725.1 DUF4393 domain-containing protein [Roseburia sp. 1XD42-69]